MQFFCVAIKNKAIQIKLLRTQNYSMNYLRKLFLKNMYKTDAYKQLYEN